MLASINASSHLTLWFHCCSSFPTLQRLHSEMLEAGVPDDVFTLTALITGQWCCLHVLQCAWLHACSALGCTCLTLRPAARQLSLPGSCPFPCRRSKLPDPPRHTCPLLHPPAACERIGHWQGAEEHFLEFQSRGILPNTIAYNRLISALGRGGQWERALAAFDAMQGSAEAAGSSNSASAGSSSQSSSSSGTGGGSGSRTGGSGSHTGGSGSRTGGSGSHTGGSGSRTGGSSTPSANGSTRAGREGGRRTGSPSVSSAASSKHTMPSALAPAAPAATTGRGSGSSSDSEGEASAAAVYAGSAPAKPDRITYGSLISALERGGQWERALAVYEDMLAAGIQVRQGRCLFADAAIVLCCACGHWYEWRHAGSGRQGVWCCERSDAGLRLHGPLLPPASHRAHVAVLAARSNSRCLRAALLPPQPNGYIFTSLINACEKGGQWERAVALFKVMQVSWAACVACSYSGRCVGRNHQAAVRNVSLP